jgi:YHS domain-containing protein
LVIRHDHYYTLVKGVKMEIDPVCKMEVDPVTAKWKVEYKGKIYYFCSPGCKRSFEKDPESYLANPE